MTETPEVSEDTAERDTAERDTPEKDPPPAGPRGVDGETRVVAERSGSDTTFPARPLLADPDDARRVPGEESLEGASDAEAKAEADAGADEETDTEAGAENTRDAGGAGDEAEGSAGEGEDTSGEGTPEPEVGPAS